jgi:adenylosuccinate synthase
LARRAFAVVDLGFGDAGKGHVTDSLVRETGATAVVRFNGGAQAGHNVVTADGRHHTFAQFGSGSFVPGVKTLLSRHVVLDPLALWPEEQALRGAGVTDGFARLVIHRGALVATPFHRAVNCAREERRGAARHGSCGVGFGETVQDSLADPAGALRAGDLLDPRLLRTKLARIAEHKLEELRALGGASAAEQLGAADIGERVEKIFLAVGERGVIADDRRWQAELKAAETIVFEGAQGLLLCERHGFPPHTSWSRCDLHNVDEIVADAALDAEVTRLGVLRAVAVRHGPGALPTEEPELAPRIAEAHNRENPWQGPVRYGWFDAVLARYAIAAVGGLDALALTHLDTVATLPRALACDAYDVGAREIRELTDLGPATTDEHRRTLGARLREARPRLAAFETRSIGERLGCDVAIESRGPTHEQVRFVRPL